MKKNILIFIMFFILIIVMTYPLVFKINTYMPGFFSSDESYAPIWNAWWLRFAKLNNISIKNINVCAYPFGITYSVFGNLFFAINYALAILTNPVATYNIQVISNLFLSAAFVYLLVHLLTKSMLSAFLSGIAFGFCPYIFTRSWQHLGETYLWMMPFVLWALFKLKNKFTKMAELLFVLGIFLTSISFNTVYYTAFILSVALAYFTRYFFKNKTAMSEELFKENIRYIKRLLLLGAIASALLLTQIYPFLKNAAISRATKASAFNPYHRPFDDLFTQSAKPLSYFLPATTHPLFGKFTEQFIGSPLYGISYTEHTLYLGWVPLILAFVAFRRWRRNRKLIAHSSELIGNGKEQFYIGFFVWLAFIAWLFSQPPYFTFPYFKIYMPSFFMYKIMPMFRAYCRFGIVVMLAISVLAGFGLKFLLEKFRDNRTKLLFSSLICGLVLIEFLNFPPFKVIDLTKYPKVYDWLEIQKGDFAIAEYPLDTKSPNEYYRFCQTIHERKIINGTIPGTYANDVAKAIWRLSDPQTARMLKWMDVKYVIVHLTSFGRSNEIEVLDELDRIKTRRLPGLKYVSSFDDADVYEVVAEPEKINVNE